MYNHGILQSLRGEISIYLRLINLLLLMNLLKLNRPKKQS